MVFTRETVRTQSFKKSAFPAKAGTHLSIARASEQWIPAFAGNAVFFVGLSGLRASVVKSIDYGKALRSGARVTTDSMSAIALPMKRAVIGVPS